MNDLPEDVQTLLERAEWYFKKERWEFAARMYTRLLNLVEGEEHALLRYKPKYYLRLEAYTNRGIARSKAGSHDSALKDFDKALKLNADSSEAYNGRGNVHSEKGDLDRAIADFDKAIELQPDRAAFYENRALVYSKKGEHDRAIVDFDKALQRQPENATTYSHRGVTYRDKGEFELAIADFNKALEIRPNYSSAYNNRGTVYFSQSDYDRAIADFNEAIKLDPENTASIHNRARAVTLKESAEQQEKIHRQYKEQLENQQKKFDAEIEKNINEYTRNFLRIEEYEMRKKEYEQKTETIGERVEYWLNFLKYCTAVVLPTVVGCIAGGIYYVLKQDIPDIRILWMIIPVITTIGLCSVPFFWHIRTLKQEKARLMALSQDAYTKGVLANLINVNPGPAIRKELLHKFFDHHAQSDSAKLIVDLENNTKSDGAANVFFQQVKDNFPGEKK